MFIKFIFNLSHIKSSKFYIKVIESKFKGNPKYQLLPTNPYIVFKKDGKVIYVGKPRRYKNVDKNKSQNNLNDGVKEIEVEKENVDFDKIDKIKYTIINDKVFIETSNDDFIEEEFNGYNTNPYYFINILKDKIIINGHRNAAKYLENFFYTLSIHGDDKTKLKFLNFFLSADYITLMADLYGRNELYRILEYDGYLNVFPTYRHFLQLFLSLDNPKILNNPLYRNGFKVLLFLDWVQDKNYLSFLETIIFHFINIFGKDKFAKVIELDDYAMEYMNVKKTLAPIPKMNIKTLVKVMEIIKEMKKETQEELKRLNNQQFSKRLYRGLKIDFKMIKEKSNNKINNLIDVFNEYIKTENLEKFNDFILNLIKEYKTKMFESWTNILNISNSFAGLYNTSKIINFNDEINVINEKISKENILKLKEPFIGVVLSFNITDEKEFNNHLLMSYFTFYKYLNKMAEYGETKSYYYFNDKFTILELFEILPAMDNIQSENEIVMFNTSFLLKPKNIYIVGVDDF